MAIQKELRIRSQKTLYSSHFLTFADHMTLGKLHNCASSFFFYKKHVMPPPLPISENIYMYTLYI